MKISRGTQTRVSKNKKEDQAYNQLASYKPKINNLKKIKKKTKAEYPTNVPELLCGSDS